MSKSIISGAVCPLQELDGLLLCIVEEVERNDSFSFLLPSVRALAINALHLQLAPVIYSKDEASIQGLIDSYVGLQAEHLYYRSRSKFLSDRKNQSVAGQELINTMYAAELSFCAVCRLLEMTELTLFEKASLLRSIEEAAASKATDHQSSCSIHFIRVCMRNSNGSVRAAARAAGIDVKTIRDRLARWHAIDGNWTNSLSQKHYSREVQSALGL